MDDVTKRLIRLGAELELAQLRKQMKPLEALLARGPRPGRSAKPRRVVKMSAAARKAVSRRMKAYWAARRKAKKP